MEKQGRDLEFVSLIKRDGSGVVPAGTEWNEESGHARTDDLSYLDDIIFELRFLSLKHETYIATSFNAWVVKLKR